MKPKVTIHTDGGAEPNPGAAGWGAVLRSGEHVKELYGSITYATNNAAELTAAIMALRALKTACEVELFSDSQYLIYTMTRGWSRGKNRELWQQLDTAAAPHVIAWSWVRGHAGNADNERAHELAEQGIREAKDAA